MKRIMAFLLCWAMLLSQVAMIAEAAHTQELSDILYLENQGVHIEGDGQVFMDNAPLGKSDDVARYSPSVPKFIPDALRSLGLTQQEEEEQPSILPADYKEATAYEPGDRWVTYSGKFNKDRVQVYQYVGLDAESVWFNGTPDCEMELLETIDPNWYQLDCGFDGLERGYSYVRAQDIDMTDKAPVRGKTMADASGLTVRVEGLPSRNVMRVVSISANRAPAYRFGENDPGIRTLLASCSVSVRGADGKDWQPDGEVEVFLTLPEIPELSERGTIYVLQENQRGKVTVLHPTRYFLSNTISIVTSELSNYYVYSVDYAEMEDYVELPPMGETTTLSDLYAAWNCDRPFEDVKAISFAEAETVAVEPFFNEDIGMNDWRITVRTPSYIPLGFRITYKGDLERGGVNHKDYTFGSDLRISLGENLKYSISADLFAEGFVTRGNNTIRLGYASESASEQVTMTFNGANAHMSVLKSTDVLNLTVNENCDGSTFVRGSYTGDLVQVGGTLHIDGGEKSFLHLSGDYRTGKTQALVRIVDGGRAYARGCYIEEAINNNSGGAVSVSEDGYFRAVETVYIENNQSVRGNGGGISSLGTVRLECDVVVGGNTAGKDGGGIYSSGRFYGAELLITENEATREGGGLCNDGGEVSFAGVLISNNVAENGGGLAQTSGTLAFYDCKNSGSIEGEGLDVAENDRPQTRANPPQWSESSSITGNTARSRGGGIEITEGAIGVFITNGTQINIYLNVGNYGGGMFLGGASAGKNTQIWFVYTGNGSFDINRNTGKLICGGLMVESCTLSMSVPMYIKHNTAQNCDGGGFYVGYGPHGPVIVNVEAYMEIGGNTAVNGGGVYLSSGSINIKNGKTMWITNKGQLTTEWDKLANKANTASKGAGMYIAGGSFYVEDGFLKIDNNGTSGTGQGGAVYLAGGTLELAGNSARAGSEGYVADLNVQNNKAWQGAGIYLNGGTLKTNGVSRPLIGNNGDGSSLHGSGIHAQNGTITIESKYDLCVYRNFGQYGPGMFFGQGGGKVTIDGSGAGSLWVHENHDYNATTGATGSSADGAAVWIEACTVELKHKMLMTRQVHGAANSAGQNGSSKGCIKIQQYPHDGTGITGVLNIYAVLEIQGCTGADWAGGITMAVNSSLNVKSGGTLKITGCSNTGSGAAIQNTDGSITCDGTMIINNNTSGGSGGGIWTKNAPTFRIEGTGNEMKGNVATGQGGAIWANNQASVILKNCTIDGNTAKNGHAGGVIYYRGDGVAGSFSVTNCNITNNKCLNEHGKGVNGNTEYDDDRGAGIYAQEVSLTISDGSITGNTTPYGKGGGIYFNSGAAAMTVSGCNISGNEAHRTGATDVNKSGYGGGICVDKASGVSITDCTINNNIADSHGGGIASWKAVSVAGGSISNNTANWSGGGIYVTKVDLTVDGTTIQGNVAKTVNGGGIYIWKDDATASTLTLKGATTISDNCAGESGGGVYANGCTVNASEVTKLSITYNRAGVTKTVTNGTATYTTSSTGGEGGGIYFDVSGLNMTLANATIGNNHVYAGSIGQGRGGGIFAYFGNVDLGENSKVENNTAQNYGGGIFLYSDAATGAKTLTVGKNCVISGNTATEKDGGGIYASRATVSLNGNAEVHSNHAGLHGGGVCMMDYTTLNLNGTASIHHNEAVQNGGGILYANGSIQINGTNTVYANKADNGGGIFASVSLTLNGALIVGHENAELGNEADVYGGGIYGNGNVSLIDAKVLNNYAGTDGSGIYCKNDVKLTDITIENNFAKINGGGIRVENGRKVEFIGACCIRNNGAGNDGGGVYINAGTIDTSATTTMIFDGNYANANGGGLYLNSATAILTNAQFKNNKALGFGGGIYSNHTKLDLNSGNSFDGNMAGTDKDGNAVDGHEGSGGGIWFGGENYTLTLNAVELKYNSAHRGENTSTHGNGGGVYMGPSSILKLTGAVKIHDNHADDAYGGGIYLPHATLVIEAVNNAAPHIYSNSALCGGGISVSGTKEQNWSDFSMTIGGEIAAENGDTVEVGNRAKWGGGVYANGTNLTIGPKVVIRNNTASTQGGGIYIKKYDQTVPTLILTQNTVLSDNTAGTHGGGIYAYNGAVEVEANVEIHSNTATNHGGGIYSYCGNVTLGTGVSVYSNNAGESGGGIYIIDNVGDEPIPTLTICADVVIKENTARMNGGGVYASLVNVTCYENVQILKNSTEEGHGGGLYVYRPHNKHTYSDGIVTVEKVYPVPAVILSGTDGAEILIQENISGKQGGGLYVYGSHLTMEHCSVTDNISAKMGGGLLVVSYGEGNYENEDGSPKYTLEDNLDLSTMVCSITNSTISDNTSGANAGGIYAEGYGLLNFNNVAIERNSTVGYGGGMVLSMKTYSPTITNCTVNKNEASTDGGGAYIYNITKEEAVLTGTDFTNNKAGGNGGGLWLNGVWMKIDNTNTISGNSAGEGVVVTRTATPSATGGNGGGIYVNSADPLTLENVTIENNHAYASGNTNGNGGGIYVLSGTLNLIGQSNTVRQNSAVNGGGIYIDKGTLNLTDGITLYNNIASNNGGGIYTKTDLTLGANCRIGCLSGETKLGNFAKFGGGIYVEKGTVTLQNGASVCYNKAGLAVTTAVDANGVWSISGTEEVGGHGGGIYIAGGSVEIYGDSSLQETKRSGVKENICYALETENEQGETVWGGGLGAGVYMTGGSLTLDDGALVKANSAELRGGGIYMTGGALNLTGASAIEENEATGAGGGIFYKGGTIALSKDESKYAKIRNNRALSSDEDAGAGGGIYMEKTDLTLEGYLLVDSNEAASGGGIHAKSMDLVLDGAILITNNMAKKQGGGMKISYVNLTMKGGAVVSFNKTTTESGGGSGGGIYAYGGVDSSSETYGITLLDVTMEGNEAFGGGGGIISYDVSITLGDETHQTVMKDNQAGVGKTGNGGAILIQKYYITDANNPPNRWLRPDVGVPKLTVANAEFLGNQAGAGGAIRANDADVEISNGIFTNNIAKTGGGGAIAFTNNSTTDPDRVAQMNEGVTLEPATLTISKSAFTCNQSNNGGAIYATGTVLTDTESTYEQNIAYKSGGGIYCMDTNATLNSKVFSGNQAGATVTVNEDETVTYSASGNGGNGGAIFFTVSKSEIVLDEVKYTLTIESGEFTGNKAFRKTNLAIGEEGFGRGGAIAVQDCNLTMTGAVNIHDNHAEHNGGGVHVFRTDNEATKTYPVPVCTIEGQARQVVEGAEGNTYTYSFCIGGNTAAHQGGGVYVYGCSLDAKDVKFSGNTAVSHGAGLLLVGYTVSPGTTIANLNLSDLRCAVTDSEISGNHSGGKGGGMYIENYRNEQTKLTNTVIKSNHANDNGGGLYVQYSTMTLEENVHIIDNSSDNHGGGICVFRPYNTANSQYDETTFKMIGKDGAPILIQGNTALAAGVHQGGGAYIRGCHLEAEHVDIIDNHAVHMGGGILMVTYPVVEGVTNLDRSVMRYSFKNCTFTNNSTLINAGGLYIEGYQHEENGISNTTFSGNAAKQDGGAIYLRFACMTMDGTSDIGGNYAGATMEVNEDKSVTYTESGEAGNGGGIYAHRDAELTIKSGTIRDNYAYGGGGGIYAAQDTGAFAKVMISGGSITGNMANKNGGGIYLLKASATISDCEISGNHAGKGKDHSVTGGNGGGIYATGNTQLNVTGTTISQNYAYINGSEGGRGGGIYVSSASLEMSGATVSKNHADSMGGGICTTLSPVTLTSVTVQENTAQNGGGMRLHKETATLEDCTITGNKATTETEGAACNGGGLYLYLTEATITGGSLSNNYAKKSGGGICVSSSEESTTTTKLTVISTDGKSPIRDNTADVSANDIYADGHHTQLIMSATTVDGTKTGAAEYWFADYPTPNTEKGENLTIPNVFFSDYVNANGELINLGRYNENTTPVTYARRSFGGTSTEPGAAAASTAYLALTLGTAEHLFMDLTLTKKISDAVGKVVEPTTFIFYIKGVDDEDFLLPVAIHIDPLDNSKGKEGDVTIRDLPVGFYDICEAEGWSWRYKPSEVAFAGNRSEELAVSANGDTYIRVQATATADEVPNVAFTNALDSKLWLTDADYLPFLPENGVQVAGRDDEEEETE